MALTDSMDALKALLGCIHSDGEKVSDAYIEEKQQEAKLKKLHLSGITLGMLLIATDEGRKLGKAVCMSPLFRLNGKYDQNCACDAVLVRKVETGCELYYIELKSDSPSGYSGQFKSTRAFMRYTFDLMKELCSVHSEIVRERFIVFHTDSRDATRRGKKQKTRFSPKDANAPESPEMLCVRNGDTVRCTEVF